MAEQCGEGCIRPVGHSGPHLTTVQGLEIVDSIGEDGLTGHATRKEKIEELQARVAEIREGIRETRERLSEHDRREELTRFKDGVSPCVCGAVWQPLEEWSDESFFLQHTWECEYQAWADKEAADRVEADNDDRMNNLLAAGAVCGLLRTTKAGYRLIPGKGPEALTDAQIVMDADGNATNQIDITLSFMQSPYRITVERVTND